MKYIFEIFFQQELERLNQASSDINKMENELEVKNLVVELKKILNFLLRMQKICLIRPEIDNYND